MLQQTQVSTVIDYFNAFLVSFPDLFSLASASDDRVMAQWAGLGYYSRARNLHKTAKIVCSQYQGSFPKNYKELITLPGIGPSTAGAILSLGSNLEAPILDGNVKRVLSRYHRVEGHYSNASVMKSLWGLAASHTPPTRSAEYTQAIMDIGATVCTSRNPSCDICPISIQCEAFLNNEQLLFPQKKPRKISKPEKSLAFLIYINEQQEIFLYKRPTKGIWGGLWSFEECKDEASTIKKTIKAHNKKAKIIRRLDRFKHRFTHYNLWICLLYTSPSPRDRG